MSTGIRILSQEGLSECTIGLYVSVPDTLTLKPVTHHGFYYNQHLLIW
jgi:hypothetical protein